MKVYQTDSAGNFVGVITLDDTDKCPITGNYLIPALATDQEPPTPAENQVVRFLDGAWTLEDIPVPESDPEPTATEIKKQQYASINATYSVKLSGIVQAIATLQSQVASDLITAKIATLQSLYASTRAEWKVAILAV